MDPNSRTWSPALQFHKWATVDSHKPSLKYNSFFVPVLLPFPVFAPITYMSLLSPDSWLYKEATVTSTEAAGSDDDTQTMIVNTIMSAAAFSKFRAKFGDLRRISKR